MDNTQTILLLESGDLEVYEGKRPEELMPSNSLDYDDYMNTGHDNYMNTQEWLSTKQTVKLAEGEVHKLMDYLLLTKNILQVTAPVDVSEIVEIRDGLGYFKEPVVEENYDVCQIKLWCDVMDIIKQKLDGNITNKECSSKLLSTFTIKRK